MNRITVTDIFNCQDPKTVVSHPYKNVFINNYYIFAVRQDPILDVFELKTFILKQSFPIPSNKVVAVNSYSNCIALAFQNQPELFIYSEKNKELNGYKGHIGSITCLIVFENSFVTGSNDFTIRFWDISKNNLEPFAITGHSKRISCFSQYGQYLLSGSADKTLKLWANKKEFSSTKFDEELVQICPCPFTSQLCVFTKDGKLTLIKMINLKKGKPLEFKVIIQLNEICMSSCEIDDSFLVVSTLKKLIYVELNLDQIVKQHKIDGQISNIVSLGRILVFGNRGKGIQLIKL